MSKNYSTFYLLKGKGSLFTGASTIFNLSGNFFSYNYSKSGEEADFKAIENDWGVIGKDFTKSLKELKSVKSKQLEFKF